MQPGCSFYIFLTHRVTHRLSPDQVYVDMEYRLARISTSIDNQTIAWFLYTLLFSNLASDRKQVPHQIFIGKIHLVDRANVFVRYIKFRQKVGQNPWKELPLGRNLKCEKQDNYPREP